MAQHLKNIELDEVSLVDKGANQHAHVVLMKAAGKAADDVDKAMSFVEAINQDVVSDRLAELMEAFHRSIGSIQADPEITNKSAAVAESAAQFHAAVAALAKEYDMSDNRDELMKSLTDKVSKLESDLAAAEEANTKLTADLEAATSPESDAGTEINKADLPESVQKALADAEDLKKRADEQAERIQKMEDDASRKEWINKSANIGIGAKDDEVGDLLHGIAKHDGGMADKVHSLLKSAAAAVATGKLFDTLGGSGSGDETALDKVNKKAAEYAEKNGTTKAVAVTKVLDADPALYAKYRAEQN